MRLFIVALLVAISYAQTDNIEQWADNDCREIRRKGDCFAYYYTCKEECDHKRNYDRNQARTDAGINDGNTLSGECAVGDQFEDSRGFTCDTYEGANWCAKDENDITVEGPGWCKRWPRSDYHPIKHSDCRVMPGKKRMLSFEHYVNANGVYARKCCCNSELASTYPYALGWGANGGTCNDRTFNSKKNDGVAWHDKNGWTCRVYHFGNLCNMDGQRGAGWNNAEWGTFEEHRFDDMHAKQACCACGGGLNAPDYDDLPGHLLRRMDKFIDKGYNERDSQNWNRIKKHARSIIHLDGKNYDPNKIILVENIETITKLPLDQFMWDAMIAEWNALKVLHPDFNWMG